jgi:ureidoglycolate hydrolase
MCAELADLVQVGASFAQTYAPVLEFEGWRVAMLRYNEAVAPANLTRVERHWNSNEVFILTAGAADLIILGSSEEERERDVPVRYFVEHMRPSVAYNVGQSVWHHVVMTQDAHIVLIEKADTGPATSNYWDLPAELAHEIAAAFYVQP